MESEKGKSEKESEKQTAEETPFRMMILDRFLTSQGLVIKGTIETGVLHVGDEVQIVSRNGFRCKAIAKAIEQFNKKVDKAVPDRSPFAILIGGLANSYVRNLMDSGHWIDRGGVLCSPGIVPLTHEEIHKKSESLSIDKSALAKGDTYSHHNRGGDGTTLGIAIIKGTYKPEAGSEKIGYFDPKTAPFRAYSGGKIGLLQGQLADDLIQMILSVGVDTVRSVYGSIFDKTEDVAVDLAIKLGLLSTKQVPDVFQQLAKKKSVSEFLLATTTMPFFLTYTIEKPMVLLAEVEHELKLNALANILLNDSAFRYVQSVEAFEKKARSLWDDRKEEVEEKKQWAIDFKKSRNV